MKLLSFSIDQSRTNTTCINLSIILKFKQAMMPRAL